MRGRRRTRVQKGLWIRRGLLGFKPQGWRVMFGKSRGASLLTVEFPGRFWPGRSVSGQVVQVASVSGSLG